MANKIVIGTGEAQKIFTDDSLMSLKIDTQADFVADELSIDTLDFTINSKEFLDLSAFDFGTVVDYFFDDVLQGRFYFNTSSVEGTNIYAISCVSIVGLLDRQVHYGGIYNAVPFADVLGEIIGGTVEYEVADTVQDIAVSGYLPPASARENLHQLLFSSGVMLRKDTAGVAYFAPEMVGEAEPIPDDRIYIGGAIRLGEKVTGVEVTEHTFVPQTPTYETSIFYASNKSPVTDKLVIFKQPYHSLSTSSANLTIGEYGDNYAYVSGWGVLKGIPYDDNTSTVTKGETTGLLNKGVIGISDVTLVSPLNAVSTVSRLWNFYSTRKNVNIQIVKQNEACGKYVSFRNPYDNSVLDGYITHMSIEATKDTLIANCDILVGYKPLKSQSDYTTAILLTGSGTWEVPAEVLTKDTPRIMVHIIGGGNGGSSGESGACGSNGFVSEDYRTGYGGVGGKAGGLGKPGKVLIQTIDITAPTTFNYSCGAGGQGGAATGVFIAGSSPDYSKKKPSNLGSAGTKTTFGTYSSDAGEMTAGVTNAFSGEIYGAIGKDGLGNGNRGNGYSPSTGAVTPVPPIVYNGVTYSNGADKAHDDWGIAGGGGAAYTANGYDAGIEVGYPNKGGQGANGADGTTVNYGCGGNGGSGGGGGGGGSAVRVGSSVGRGGNGGSGGAGSNGGDGCVLIYY